MSKEKKDSAPELKEKKIKEPKVKEPKKAKVKGPKEKKPLTEAQVERRKDMIKGLKDMIAPAVVIAVVALVIFIAVKLANKPEVYNDVRAYVREVEEGTVEPDLVLENDDLLLTLDPVSTRFTVKQKSTGKVWSSFAEGAENDTRALESEKEKLLSNIILSYSQVNGLETVFDSNSFSVGKGYYKTEKDGDTIKVFYSMGNIEREYIIPPAILAEDLDKWKANMDRDASQYVSQYYKKYDIDKLGAKDDKDELLANYPELKNHVLYILRSTAKENNKKVLEQNFEAAGYTFQDYVKDKQLDNAEKVNDKPIFNVEMDLRLEGNDLVVEIPFKSLEFKTQYPLYSIIPLPYFGAADTSKEGYLFVPEGGGAIINYNNGKSSQSDYYANVYGWDMCLRRDYVIHNTRNYFNVFGQATEGSSYICIMEEGASYASVRAAISGRVHSYNYVDARYQLCQAERFDISSIANAAVYAFLEELPDESIVQRYRFIDSSDYNDMAHVYGDYLRSRDGSYLTENNETEAPVAVELVGAVDKVRQILGVPVSRPLRLTSFKEAAEIMKELSAEDIGDLSFKYTGWCNGGVNQKILKKAKPISALGSSGDLKKLSKTADELGVDLYLDGITQYEHQSTIFNGFFSFRDAARLLTKERAELFQYSAVTYAAREGAKSYYLLHTDLTMKTANALAKAANKYNTGISYNDVGMDLSSDFYRKKTYSREAVADLDVDLLKTQKDEGRKVAINMGNDYAVPYADLVTNMDLKGNEYTLIDELIPFYQMALHGYVNYTGESLNLCGQDDELLLNSAEYGAGLSFTLMKESSFALQKTLYTQYYGAEYASWKDRMIEICKRYNSEMGHVFNQKMTGHKKLANGVFCTEYEDGTKVYVNYSYTDPFTADDGTLVKTRDYTVVR